MFFLMFFAFAAIVVKSGVRLGLDGLSAACAHRLDVQPHKDQQSAAQQEGENQEKQPEIVVGHREGILPPTATGVKQAAVGFVQAPEENGDGDDKSGGKQFFQHESLLNNECLSEN